jgi:hypothetical protein
MRICRLKCRNSGCGGEIRIDWEVLCQEISTEISTGEKVVDFVCPECGHGERQPIPAWEDVELRQDELLSRGVIYHATLRCMGKGCPAKAARVHTVKESEDPEAKPKKPISQWTLVGVRCFNDHPVIPPLVVLEDPVPIGKPDAVA